MNARCGAVMEGGSMEGGNAEQYAFLDQAQLRLMPVSNSYVP